ncbi:MAG: PDZ domain-containing protein [Dehalococcoidia bacterium]|nr:PDZ domain-containing protein [Dehalococcoidia bacterium]
MQNQNTIKKIILGFLACATIGFIYYDVELKNSNDNTPQIRSQLRPKIEEMKKTGHIKKNVDMRQQSTHGKPDMGKPSMGKPSMGKQKEFYNKKQIVMDKNFSGIGAMIIKLGDFVYIQKIIPNGPANNAGLQIGDKIISIDSKNTNNLTSREITKIINGKAGTLVTLEIERQDGTTIALSIERAVLNLKGNIVS